MARRLIIDMTTSPFEDGPTRTLIELNHMTIWTLHIAPGGYVVGKFLFPLELTIQEDIDIVSWQPGIERGRQLLARRGWLYQMRRDDDDEVGFVLLITSAPEQRTEDRDRSKPRELREVANIFRLQQAGDGETLAIAQLDRGARLALDERRDQEA